MFWNTSAGRTPAMYRLRAITLAQARRSALLCNMAVGGAGGAAGGVQTHHLAPGHGQHAPREAVAQVLLHGEGQAAHVLGGS